MSQDTARPFISSKAELHPDIMGDGRQTVHFFQENFGFTGQEVRYDRRVPVCQCASVPADRALDSE